MSFEVGKNDAFEIPLNYVNNCITAKNEVTLEFSNNDDAPVNLSEAPFGAKKTFLAFLHFRNSLIKIKLVVNFFESHFYSLVFSLSLFVTFHSLQTFGSLKALHF